MYRRARRLKARSSRRDSVRQTLGVIAAGVLLGTSLFATGEYITARQRAAGALPGYYGKWAIWREATPEQVAGKLAAGAPYVVRFRYPGLSGGRVSFTDAIRGELSADDNRNDIRLEAAIAKLFC